MSALPNSSATPYGKRLLPSLVDEIAVLDPSRILFSIPRTSNPADGFTNITTKVFARAVNRCCHFVVKHLGRGTNYPTMTYIGPQDLVYVILILAAVKTGYKLLLTSPRNNLEAELSLFDQTSCQIILLPVEYQLPLVRQILGARQMRVVEIPGQPHWLQDGQEASFPYSRSYESAKYEPLVVLHTSGSTGLPKPITINHATWTPTDAQNNFPAQGLQPVYPNSVRGERA